ncbi:hypothetical protein D3C71_1592660 [compost metagenome]
MAVLVVGLRQQRCADPGQLPAFAKTCVPEQLHHYLSDGVLRHADLRAAGISTGVPAVATARTRQPDLHGFRIAAVLDFDSGSYLRLVGVVAAPGDHQ